MNSTQVRRNRLKCLAKALVRYSEGPAEIDSLLDGALNQLGECIILMKGAQARAAEELERSQQIDDIVHNKNGEVDTFLMRQRIRELAVTDPGVMMELLDQLRHDQQAQSGQSDAD